MSPTVLLVNDVATIGGGQTVMLDIARVLLDAGFDAHVACPPGHLADESAAIGAKWHEFVYSQRRLLTERWRVPRPQAAVARIHEGRRLAALAEEVGADIVHTGALIPHIDAEAAGARLRTRTVWHLNQVHPPYLFAGTLPDKIISVSQAALQPALWRPRATRRSVIVPHGIDLERFRQPTEERRLLARARLGLRDAFTVVTVARLEPLKGVDTLIRAAAQTLVDLTLLVVGDSAGFSGGTVYAEGLRTLAQDLHVDVRFLGSRPGVEEVLWAADVFGYASRWDAAPLVLAEAAAAGLPVVTSNAGGCSEMVIEGSTAIVLDPEDVVGFAAAIDRLADDPGLRMRLGVAGQRRAAESFDRTGLPDRLLPHYRSLLTSS